MIQSGRVPLSQAEDLDRLRDAADHAILEALPVVIRRQLDDGAGREELVALGGPSRRAVKFTALPKWSPSRAIATPW
jgi:hypothetical protein